MNLEYIKKIREEIKEKIYKNTKEINICENNIKLIEANKMDSKITNILMISILLYVIVLFSLTFAKFCYDGLIEKLIPNLGISHLIVGSTFLGGTIIYKLLEKKYNIKKL